MNGLRYYIKADSHNGLKKLKVSRQCSLKTKQCNNKSGTHDFKPDVGSYVRWADIKYK